MQLMWRSKPSPPPKMVDADIYLTSLYLTHTLLELCLGAIASVACRTHHDVLALDPDHLPVRLHLLTSTETPRPISARAGRQSICSLSNVYPPPCGLYTGSRHAQLPSVCPRPPHHTNRAHGEWRACNFSWRCDCELYGRVVVRGHSIQQGADTACALRNRLCLSCVCLKPSTLIFVFTDYVYHWALWGGCTLTAWEMVLN